MNLKQFYFENFDKSKDANYEFSGEALAYLASNDFDLELVNESSVFQEWKLYLRPEYLSFHNEDELSFSLLSFWLYKNRYIVKEFPFLLIKNYSRFDFINQIERHIRVNKYDGNIPPEIDEIQEFIDGMTIIMDEGFKELFNSIHYELNAILNPREEKFQNMSVDEKLAWIGEIILKITTLNDKYLKIHYNQILMSIRNKGKFKEFKRDLLFLLSPKSKIVFDTIILEKRKTETISYFLSAFQILRTYFNKMYDWSHSSF